MTGWTEERRRKQAEAIRRWKPWEKSTGPTTDAGKARCSQNAAQADKAYLRETRKLLRLNRDFLEQWKALQAIDHDYDQ